jgi:hypothetical protein
MDVDDGYSSCPFPGDYDVPGSDRGQRPRQYKHLHHPSTTVCVPQTMDGSYRRQTMDGS